jgi:ABC-type Zn uptake system ZnuABC Zn-binding protein ZnuA
MRHNLSLGAACALLVAIAVCGAAQGQASLSPAPAPLNVVATTTVLADLVAQTGGPLVTVSSLVPKGGEVHTYEPSPDDAVRLADADLIVMNGLGLDHWLLDLIQTTGNTDAPLVALAENLPGVAYLAPEHADEPDPEGSSPGHETETVNPHLWLNVGYAELYVDRLIEALVAADPTHAADFSATGTAYRDQLATLDTDIRALLATIPEDRRRVVSLHEAFPYLAAAYGLQIVGSVLQNPGQEPSAADIAALIDQVRAEGAAAILAEGQFPQDLVDVLAQETGVAVVRGLYSDTLGDPPVDTYEGMMRYDAQLIADALR